MRRILRYFLSFIFILIFSEIQQSQAASPTEAIRIRLVALKNSHEPNADGDATMADNAVKAGAAKGLSISFLGQYNIDKNGEVRLNTYEDLDGLRSYISGLMKKNAVPGDTFIVFTIGHGSPQGTIANLGQRSAVMHAIALAAEENHQRTLWWELNCYASAGLPAVSTLPPDQQHLLSVVASSSADKVSYFGTQGKIMEKVFLAMAADDKTIDPNADGTITAGELRNFLNLNNNGQGALVYSIADNEPIFGADILNLIPIVDTDGVTRKCPKGYIPVP